MLSDKFIFRPSKWVGCVIACGGAVSAAGMLIIPIYPVLRIAAAAAIFYLFARQIRLLAFLRGGNAVCGLLFRRHETAVLNADGAPIDAGQVESAAISPLLTTAVIKGRRRRYAVLLMADSLPQEEYRQCRVRLNIAQAKKPQST